MTGLIVLTHLVGNGGFVGSREQAQAQGHLFKVQSPLS